MKQLTLPYKLDREKNWHRKNSITDHAEKMFQQATLENYGQAEMSLWDDLGSKHQFCKKDENKHTLEEEYWVMKQ